MTLTVAAILGLTDIPGIGCSGASTTIHLSLLPLSCYHLEFAFISLVSIVHLAGAFPWTDPAGGLPSTTSLRVLSGDGYWSRVESTSLVPGRAAATETSDHWSLTVERRILRRISNGDSAADNNVTPHQRLVFV